MAKEHNAVCDVILLSSFTTEKTEAVVAFSAVSLFIKIDPNLNVLNTIVDKSFINRETS